MNKININVEKEEEDRPIVRDHSLYLGQTKPFTDLNNNTYEESFWIKGIVADPFLKTLEIRNYGFKSIDDFNRGGVAFDIRDSGVGNVVFKGEAFDRIINANQELVGGIILTMKQIQALIKDYPSEDGSEMVSFFADATDL